VNWLTTILQAFGKPFQWWVVVAPWERGLLIRLGRVAKVLEPGPHFRIPFLDRVYVQSIRKRTIVDTGYSVTSKDGAVLTVSIAIDFAITDVRCLYDSMANPEVTISTMAASRIAQYVSGCDRVDLSPDAIGSDATRNVLPRPETMGIGDFDVRVTGFAFSRALRVMMNEYRHGSGLYDFEKEQSGLR
jgi:hypothetical protein